MRKYIFISFPTYVFFYALLLGSLSSCVSPGSLVPTRLEVTRSSPLRPLPALHIAVTDAKAVQQLYQAAYKLPSPSLGKRQCLENTGIVYYLKFIQNTQSSEEMDLQVSGCLTLTTAQDTRQEDDQFLHLVAKVIHVDPLVPLLPVIK
ncbi:hypothetical protein [Ktedonobacter robiniae]|uniref:hypothetical protein n=1 Tax=Ktedonobacter robiniae TaxID=2778365 RepID=UPI0019165B42|nr:hypothetical protein [Ktedonobacter robiniae]